MADRSVRSASAVRGDPVLDVLGGRGVLVALEQLPTSVSDLPLASTAIFPSVAMSPAISGGTCPARSRSSSGVPWVEGLAAAQCRGIEWRTDAGVGKAHRQAGAVVAGNAEVGQFARQGEVGREAQVGRHRQVRRQFAEQGVQFGKVGRQRGGGCAAVARGCPRARRRAGGRRLRLGRRLFACADPLTDDPHAATARMVAAARARAAVTVERDLMFTPADAAPWAVDRSRQESWRRLMYAVRAWPRLDRTRRCRRRSPITYGCPPQRTRPTARSPGSAGHPSRC